MKFTPETYRIPDRPMQPFIDPAEIWDYLHAATPSREMVRDIIDKSLDKQRLTLAETAALINATDPDLVEQIKEGALQLKEKVYGNRIVLFAPLYIGNKCINNCQYCGFRTDNKEAIRKTLSPGEIRAEVEALEDNGQKRSNIPNTRPTSLHKPYAAFTPPKKERARYAG